MHRRNLACEGITRNVTVGRRLSVLSSYTVAKPWLTVSSKKKKKLLYIKLDLSAMTRPLTFVDRQSVTNRCVWHEPASRVSHHNWEPYNHANIVTFVKEKSKPEQNKVTETDSELERSSSGMQRLP